MVGMRYQPQGKLQLNRQHPLASAVRLLSLPGVHRGFDAVAQQAATTVGVKVLSTPDGAVGGFGAAVGAGSTDRITTGLVGDFPLSGRTYIFRFRRNGAGGGGLGRLFDKTAGTFGQYLFWYNSQSWLTYGFYTGTGTERNVGIPGTATTAATGQDCTAIVTHAYDGASSTINAYVNGQRVLTDSVVTGALRDAPATPLTIGNRASDNARVWDGSIELAGVIELVLSPDQAAALSGGIYQMLANTFAEDDDEAQLKSYTLTVGAGAFALAGSAASLRVNRKLTAAPGSFSLAGAASALRATRQIAVTPGMFTLNGGAAAVRTARRLAAESGAFAVSGPAAGLQVARRLEASSGEFSFAGGAAALVTSRRLSAAPGSFVLVGRGATLVHAAAPAPDGPTYVLAALPGSFALAGAPVGLAVARRLTAGAAVFSVTAGPVTMSARRRLAAGPGLFEVAGGSAVLQVSRRMPTAPGAFTIAGSDVTFRYSAQIEYARAPAGSGYTPQRHEYQPRPAQVSTGGRPPAIQENYR